MSNNFRVGQKVVCVEDRPSIVKPVPAYGRVYTVSEVLPHTIQLVELQYPGSATYHPGFRYECFRPAVEKPCDISVFTKMLTNTKVTV